VFLFIRSFGNEMPGADSVHCADVWFWIEY